MNTAPIFIACEQGTDEWHQARCGVPTASVFAEALSLVGTLDEKQQKYVDAMLAGKPEPEALALAGYKAKPTSETVKKALAGLPVGEPSEASNKLAIKYAIERISGKPYGNTQGSFFATERGHEGEFFARMKYEERNKLMVDEAGLVLTYDRMFGYSTDGFVGDDGMIEVKTPLDTIKILRIIQTGDISEYMHQMQGGLWITGRKWCDFLMAIPDLAALNNGNDLYVKRVYRDEEFIDKMALDLLAFNNRVERFKAILSAPFNKAANDEAASQELAAA
ncbi:lambda exonuclease family protein [Piscinibacter gummiphilus]|uniref:YqaJ viral recombinase family protein n=1 Tax=Piscinibacter gummiphilus TaxID=946333 RepID=A0ABZ0CTW3_9BURK|nr:YqaJ viral recombinase family protein [Piscinibacter gummiphilus]WOB06551.1 YqaJ viral recombinase family protein [Piscinibacter gummiphilus]